MRESGHLRFRQSGEVIDIVRVEGTCTTGGGFLRRACGQDAVGQCVYCGAPFCREHGERGEDYIEVCTRKSCQAKYIDLEEHHAWIAEMRVANETSICANEECMERMLHACQRCRLRFCVEHVKLHPVIERRYDPPRKVELLLCEHCQERRKIWD